MCVQSATAKHATAVAPAVKKAMMHRTGPAIASARATTSAWSWQQRHTASCAMPRLDSMPSSLQRTSCKCKDDRVEVKPSHQPEARFQVHAADHKAGLDRGDRQLALQRLVFRQERPSPCNHAKCITRLTASNQTCRHLLVAPAKHTMLQSRARRAAPFLGVSGVAPSSSTLTAL